MHRTSVLLILALTALGTSARAAEPDLTKLPPPANKKGVTYTKDIRPIFEVSCFRCHGEQGPKAGLRLDSLETVLKGGEDGKVILSGKSDKSLLVIAVSQLDEKKAMPPKPGAGRGGRGPGGPGGPGGPPPAEEKPAGPAAGAPPQGQPGGRGGFGPPPKALTAEQVGLVRAWIDQGAK